ncbi:MAG: carbon-nitrogen hydrolase family protein [Pseudomonadota bacterium]
MLRVLACQILIPQTRTAAERDTFRNALIQKLRTCLNENPHDLVVLPELSTIEYSRESFNQLNDLAETLDGNSIQTFSALASEFACTIVFGMPRRNRDVFHISQIVIGPHGELIGHFDKLHMAQFGDSMEKEFFQRGDKLLTFDCAGFKVAPFICYDIRFPELSRTLCVDHGVQLILHCGAYARDESFDTWHHFAVTRALENQVYFLSLNRAGDHFGNSIFCSPWVDDDHPAELFAAHEEDFRSLVVDAAHIESVRNKYTFLADRLSRYE